MWKMHVFFKIKAVQTVTYEDSFTQNIAIHHT